MQLKKISNKNKKMRYKKLPLPFNFRDIADAESSVYTDDRNMEDVTSNRGTMITANKIKNKYKKMRAKNNSLTLFWMKLNRQKLKIMLIILILQMLP